ncbi:hypothetical protein [Chryseobacterium soli]|uniref:hypothetical protein n=1 Tax=Chryseobacterium soli TaxID=445961 RepID=UPI000A7DFDAD|nr:hypothetical protein [Chryseobacterium soli]
MKKYTAQINNKQLVLGLEDQKEIGRIVELNKFFSSDITSFSIPEVMISKVLVF